MQRSFTYCTEFIPKAFYILIVVFLATHINFAIADDVLKEVIDNIMNIAEETTTISTSTTYANLINSIEEATVFTMNEPIITTATLALAKKFKTHVVLRGWFRWANALDYEKLSFVIPEIHEHGALFGGGVTVPALYKGENGITDEQFMDFATRDPTGNLYPAFGRDDAGYYHGSLENKAYIDYALSFALKQIDLGIDTIFMDEVNGNYTPFEGYDDYGIKSFRNYLLKKYVDEKGWKYDDARWEKIFKVPLDNKEICPDGTMKTFNYREYLKRYGFAKEPFGGKNPFANEWGLLPLVSPNRPPENYSEERNERVWKYMCDTLRNYAHKKGKNIIITANGNNKFVDFQINPMFYKWKMEENGKINWSPSYLFTWKSVVDKGKALVNKDVPVVFFHDWGFVIPWSEISREEKIIWMNLYGAEIYASGGFFAFPVSNCGGATDALKDGTVEEISRLTNFYYNNTDVFREPKKVQIGIEAGIKINIPNIAVSVFIKNQNDKEQEIQKRKRKIINLVNHNFLNYNVIEQQNIKLSLPIENKPKSVKMISPDFDEEINAPYLYFNNQLEITIPTLKYYDVIIID